MHLHQPGDRVLIEATTAAELLVRTFYLKVLKWADIPYRLSSSPICSSRNTDDGQPGEPADWVKKNIKRLERWGEGDNLHQEMIDDMKNRHRWTRNILPPSTPKRYDPNEPPFNPADILGEADNDDIDDV